MTDHERIIKDIKEYCQLQIDHCNHMASIMRVPEYQREVDIEKAEVNAYARVIGHIAYLESRL